MSTYTPAIVNPCRCCGGEAIGYSYLVSTTDWAHGVKCRYNDCQTVDQQADTAQAAAELWNSAQQQPGCSMKPNIDDLIVLILDTVLRINAQGRWHGYFSISGHVGKANLYFRPAGFDYSAPTENWPEVEHRDARFAPDLPYTEDEALAEAREMLAFARLHLLDNEQEAA